MKLGTKHNLWESIRSTPWWNTSSLEQLLRQTKKRFSNHSARKTVLFREETTKEEKRRSACLFPVQSYPRCQVFNRLTWRIASQIAMSHSTFTTESQARLRMWSIYLKGHSTPRTSVAHKKALYEPTLEWIFVSLNSFSFARNLTLFHWFFVHYRRHVCWIRGWSYECRDVSVW